MIEIESKRLSMLRETVDWLDEPRTLEGRLMGSFGPALVHQLRDERCHARLTAEAKTLDLLANATQHLGKKLERSTRSSWVAQIEERLRENFVQPTSISEMADDIGVHVTHLSRVFRSRHGCTISEFIRRLRVEYAADRLTNSSDALAKIAMDAGFADQSHFGRTFKAVMHTTPLHYRRASQPKSR